MVAGSLIPERGRDVRVLQHSFTPSCSNQVLFRSSAGPTRGNPRCSTSCWARRSRLFPTSHRPPAKHSRYPVTQEGQIVFTDTPGIHKPGYELNRRMMQTVYNSLEGTDLLLLLVDASTAFGSGDQYVVDLLKERAPAHVSALEQD